MAVAPRSESWMEGAEVESDTQSTRPEGEDHDDGNALAKRENQWVTRSKRGVYLILLLAALAMSFGTYALSKRNERAESVAKVSSPKPRDLSCVLKFFYPAD